MIDRRRRALEDPLGGRTRQAASRAADADTGEPPWTSRSMRAERMTITRTRAGWSPCSPWRASGASFVFTAIIPIQARLLDLFASGREQTAWAVTATLLVATVLTPISGRLADMIGKRRVALALLALLALGSVVLAGAQELWMLILGRGLQGAATGIIPVGIAILRDPVPARRLDTSIALMSATLGVGGALGLPISAIVNQLAGWRWPFGATAVSRPSSRRSWWRSSPRARGAAADGSTPWARRG